MRNSITGLSVSNAAIAAVIASTSASRRRSLLEQVDERLRLPRRVSAEESSAAVRILRAFVILLFIGMAIVVELDNRFPRGLVLVTRSDFHTV